MHKSRRRMITMPHRPLGAVCCEASERAHKRMNNRAPTRPKRDPDPDPNRPDRCRLSIVTSLVQLFSVCRVCYVGSRYATGSGLELGLAWLINTSSAGLVMELAHDMNVDMGSYICICICFVLPCTLTALHSS